MKKILLNVKMKNELDDDTIDELFAIRDRRLYLTKEEKEKVVKECKIENVSYDTLTNKIKELNEKSGETENNLQDLLDTFLYIDGAFNRDYRRKLYIAGINDALNFIFNENNEESENKDE